MELGGPALRLSARGLSSNVRWRTLGVASKILALELQAQISEVFQLSVVGGYIERIRKCRHSIAHIDIASSRLTCGFAAAFERAMEAMPKRRSALAMVRALLPFAPQDCKCSELLRSILLSPHVDLNR